MKAYPDVRAALQDALRLAEGMTYKFAVPGMPWGGGKAVIALPQRFNPGARLDLLRRYGGLVRQLGGLFYTGPDVGTSSPDMDIISETGAPYVFGRTPRNGGAGPSGPATALGVFTGIQVACEHLFGGALPRGRQVLVQGTGSVGGTLIDHLLEAGAEVLFSEVDESAIRQYRDEMGLQFVAPEAVFDAEYDILAPCALGGVLNAETIPQLRCRAVVGGANNQLAEPEDAERLQARGILYAPDYVVNVGGAAYVLGVETQGWSHEKAEREVVESVRRGLRQVIEVATQSSITTDAAARRLADERLYEE